MEQKKEKKKNKTAVYVLVGLGVLAAAGTVVYFATRPTSNTDLINSSAAPLEPVPTTSSPGRSSGSSSSGFPLTKGSRGTLVKNIQEALIAKYGAGVLPRFGADGHWGSEMQTALVAKGISTTIDANTFREIVTTKGSESPSSSSPTTTTSKKKKFNPSLLAQRLRIAVMDDDFTEAKRLLPKIWTVKGYRKVSDEFKKKKVQVRPGQRPVTATLVTALLTRFSSSSEKKSLNSHFARIGLKFDGDRWQLSGLGQVPTDQIRTLQRTDVWNKTGKRMSVPRHTVLGEFVNARNGVTQFRTLDDQYLYTNTNSIAYV